MLCKVYYRNSYHNNAETIDNFISCECEGKGITFTFGDPASPTKIERALIDIEDVKIFNTKPMIF